MVTTYDRDRIMDYNKTSDMVLFSNLILILQFKSNNGALINPEHLQSKIRKQEKRQQVLPGSNIGNN